MSFFLFTRCSLFFVKIAVQSAMSGTVRIMSLLFLIFEMLPRVVHIPALMACMLIVRVLAINCFSFDTILVCGFFAQVSGFWFL